MSLSEPMYEMVQSLSLSRVANVSASPGPSQLTSRKLALPLKRRAQSSHCSAQGQHPPHPVNRWRTAGWLGVRTSERGLRSRLARGEG